MELTRLIRERAVDAVYQALRQAILNSLMRPGERLHVEELAEKLGVSLTPVRHAIQQLSTEGLVEVRPRSGTFVARVTAKDVEETFEIRCALECLAAEKAIPSISEEDVERLRELLSGLRNPVRTEADRKRHDQDNWEFHLILVRAADNRRLLEMYDELNANIKIARIHASENDWLSRLDQEQKEHQEIVDAIEERNTSRLIRALRTHIFRARDSLIAAIKGIESNAT